MPFKRYLRLAFALMVLAIYGIALGIEPAAAELAAAGETPEGKIHGRVVSIYGPVENARVRLPGQKNYTLTDRQGRFTLKAAPGEAPQTIVAAGKEGWFNNAQAAGRSGIMPEIVLNPIYLADRPDYRFISPVVCARCHTKVAKYWDQSKMAHAASNPKVLDMFYGTDAGGTKGASPGYQADNPGKSGDCLVCHAPSVTASRPEITDFKTALSTPETEWDGISCDYCHKVRKVIADRSRPSGRAAVFERQHSARGNSILVFGPYDDVVAPPMAASYNPIYTEGAFCSTCHSHAVKLAGDAAWDPAKVYSSEEWDGFGLKDSTYLPVQTTFQEWKLWQEQLPAGDPNKGKVCQNCHMSWRKEMLPYDNHIVDGMARDMWGTFRAPASINPHHFDGGTETQLRTALTMELEGEIVGDRVKFKVHITNTNGGHWVPTGETMRSVMLVLQASDSAGSRLKLVSGPQLPDWTGVGPVSDGNYAGQPGTVFAKVLGDGAGNFNVPFWKATQVVSDTRVRPKTTLVIPFEFFLDNPDDEPSVQARLIYRPVTSELATAKKWNVKDIEIASSAW